MTQPTAHPNARYNQSLGVAIVTAAKIMAEPYSDTRELSLMALTAELSLTVPVDMVPPSTLYLMAKAVQQSGVDLGALGLDVAETYEAVNAVLATLPEFMENATTKRMLDMLVTLTASGPNVREISTADVFGVSEAPPQEGPR